MSRTAVAVLLFFALSSSGADRISRDEYNLARAIQGEGPRLVSDDPALAARVGQVVINRLDRGWCSTIRRCVDGGFWGARSVVVPDRWALEIAAELLLERTVTEDFYVFSLDDCSALGLDLDEANYLATNGKWGLAFYGADLEW